jgi:hypothetical protein
MATGTRQIEQWVTEGIISAEQAEAILDFEGRDARSRVTAIEVLAYVGAAMVLAAAIVLVTDLWPGLSLVERLIVLGLATVVLTVVGWISTGEKRSSMRRFGETSLLLAVAAFGSTVGVAADAVVESETASWLGFGAALAAAVGLYRRHESYPQHAAMFLAFGGFALASVILPFDSPPDALPGATILAVGAIWVAASTTERIEPRTLGEILGSVAALGGSLLFVIGAGDNEIAFTAMLIVLSIGTLVVGVRTNRVVLIAAGMIGLIAYIPWLVTDVLGDSIGAPVALLVTGSLLAASAMYMARRRKSDHGAI